MIIQLISRLVFLFSKSTRNLEWILNIHNYFTLNEKRKLVLVSFKNFMYGFFSTRLMPRTLLRVLKSTYSMFLYCYFIILFLSKIHWRPAYATLICKLANLKKWPLNLSVCATLVHELANAKQWPLNLSACATLVHERVKALSTSQQIFVYFITNY